MNPGETRTITTGDKVITVFRTNRPYVMDLCEAYNASLSEAARARGLEWRVLPTGELKLDFTEQALAASARRGDERREKERQEFIYRLQNPRV